MFWHERAGTIGVDALCLSKNRCETMLALYFVVRLSLLEAQLANPNPLSLQILNAQQSSNSQPLK